MITALMAPFVRALVVVLAITVPFPVMAPCIGIVGIVAPIAPPPLGLLAATPTSVLLPLAVGVVPVVPAALPLRHCPERPLPRAGPQTAAATRTRARAQVGIRRAVPEEFTRTLQKELRRAEAHRGILVSDTLKYFDTRNKGYFSVHLGTGGGRRAAGQSSPVSQYPYVLLHNFDRGQLQFIQFFTVQ